MAGKRTMPEKDERPDAPIPAPQEKSALAALVLDAIEVAVDIAATVVEALTD